MVGGRSPPPCDGFAGVGAEAWALGGSGIGGRLDGIWPEVAMRSGRSGAGVLSVVSVHARDRLVLLRSPRVWSDRARGDLYPARRRMPMLWPRGGGFRVGSSEVARGRLSEAVTTGVLRRRWPFCEHPVPASRSSAGP